MSYLAAIDETFFEACVGLNVMGNEVTPCMSQRPKGE
jgi:hypothetical protein